MMIRIALFSCAGGPLSGIDARNAGGMNVGDAVGHRAQIRDAHRRASLFVIAGDDGRVVAGFEYLIVVADLPALAGILKGALGPVGVGPGKRRAHRLQPHAVAPSCMGFNSTRTAGVELPPTKTLAHALNLRNLLRQDRVGHVVDLRLGHHV